MLSRFMTKKEQFVLLFVAASVVIGALALYAHETRQDSAREMPFEVVEPTFAVEEPKSPPALSTPAPSDTAAPHSTLPAPPEKVAVSVRGAVNEEGLYRCSSDDRVQDLIEMAGGTAEDADLRDINFAAPLIDGTTLTIPHLPVAKRSGDTPVLRRRSRPEAWNPPQYTLSGWRQQNQVAGNVNASRPGASPGIGAGARAATDSLIDVNHATQEELEVLPGIGPKLSAAIIQYRTGTPFRNVDALLEVHGIGPKRLEAIRGLVGVH